MRAVKQNANEGLSKMYWFLILASLILLALGGALWWYDVYEFHRA